MKAITAAATVWSVLASAAAGQPARATTAPSGAARSDALAAESVRTSAVGLTCSTASAAARARRLVVLCRLADRLAPGHWRTNMLLADIYLARQEPADEAKALAACLAVHPDDWARRLRWIDARLDRLQTSEERATVLEAVVESKDVTAWARSHAAALLAAILRGQGREQEALAAARRAVELDPTGPNGLRTLASLETGAAAIGPVARNLRLLRGELRGSGGAWQVALALGRIGLPKQAVPFLEHARTTERAAAPGGELSAGLLAQYCNGLLDAGEAKKVAELLDAKKEVLTVSADLQALHIEAHRAAEDKQEVKRLVDVMDDLYKERAAAGEESHAFEAERAWFYVLTDRKPSLAIIHARRAVEADPDNALYQRILGAAELLMNRTGPGEGADRLEKLLGMDTYASVFLAEHHFGAGSKEKGEKALLAAAGLPRSGPAFRRLSAVARENGVTIPPAEGRDKAAKVVEAFDRRYLDLLLHPEKAVAVEMTLPGPTIECGEPIRLNATFQNVSQIDIPVGQGGLLRAALSVHVEVHDRGGKQIAQVRSLPMVVWPVPRWLGAGRKRRASVRLDVAELDGILAVRPMDDVTLTLTGTLDPAADGSSSMPSIKLAPLKIVRMGLLGAFDRGRPEQWRQAYAAALGRIVADLRRGDLARRMRAARRTGHLLTLARNIEIGKGSPPPLLAGKIDKLVLLSMMRALLADRSPAVRQEMVASLAHVRLDELTIGLLAPLIEDPSPVVRCRLAELLGVSDNRKHRTVLDVMAKDTDELVRAMAKAVASRD